MPSSKKSVNVRLTDHQYQLLKEFASFSERSMASVLKELLEEALPHVQQCVQLHRGLQGLTEARKAQLLAAVDSANKDVQNLRNELLANLNAATQPPYSNRGAENPTSTTQLSLVDDAETPKG